MKNRRTRTVVHGANRRSTANRRKRSRGRHHNRVLVCAFDVIEKAVVIVAVVVHVMQMMIPPSIAA